MVKTILFLLKKTWLVEISSCPPNHNIQSRCDPPGTARNRFLMKIIRFVFSFNKQLEFGGVFFQKSSRKLLLFGKITHRKKTCSFLKKNMKNVIFIKNRSRVISRCNTRFYGFKGVSSLPITVFFSLKKLILVKKPLQLHFLSGTSLTSFT